MWGLKHSKTIPNVCNLPPPHQNPGKFVFNSVQPRGMRKKRPLRTNEGVCEPYINIDLGGGEREREEENPAQINNCQCVCAHRR